MTQISIEGYLTQGKLEKAIKSLVDPADWIGREVRISPASLKRWDFSFKTNHLIYVVEFDGDRHYRDSLTIKNDREKDLVAIGLGHEVVRVPYWVQLTTETLRHYFNITADVNQDFPHGFITTKFFPASFCELGVERFSKELIALPFNAQKSVVKSLQDRATEYGLEFVLPEKLRTNF